MAFTTDSECKFHPQTNEQQKRGNLGNKSSNNNIDPRLYLAPMEARRGYSPTHTLENQIREIAADKDNQDTPRLEAQFSLSILICNVRREILLTLNLESFLP